MRAAQQQDAPRSARNAGPDHMVRDSEEREECIGTHPVVARSVLTTLLDVSQALLHGDRAAVLRTLLC